MPKEQTDKFIIGADLGGTNLRLASISSNCDILSRKSLPTRTFTTPQDLIRAIAILTEELISEHTLKRSNARALAIGVPGPVDSEKGIVHFLPNLPGWRNVNLARILSQKLKLSVKVENDANLFTLGEFYFGAGRGFKNIVGVTLGTGIGGGIILNNALYRGGKFAAGEIGHIPVVAAGKRCNCGGRGCLEAYVGNQIILKRAERKFKRRLDLESLSRLARQGNRKAIAIWQDTGYFLGIALTGVVNLLNPDAIIIGGGVANAGKILFDKIRCLVKERAMEVQAKQVKIIRSRLGEDAALLGSTTLIKCGFIK